MDHSMQTSVGPENCQEIGSSPGNDNHPQVEDVLLTSKIDGTKTHLTDRTGRRHNLEPLTTQPEAQRKGRSALLSLPVEIVLENIIPRVEHRDLQSLAMACRAFRSALLPQLLRTVISVLPRFKSGSKVDALITFVEHFRQFFSFAAAKHVEALKITSPDDPTTPYELNRGQLRSLNWQRRTAEILWPHLLRLSVRSLTLYNIHLTNPELDGICSMQRLRSLALDDCRIDVEEPLYVDPVFRLQALDMLGIECTHPEILLAALVNPDLQHLGTTSYGDDGVFEALLPLTPLLHVVTAFISPNGLYGVVDLLPVIPNVVELRFDGFVTVHSHDFPLSPNAFPHLKKLTTDGIHYIQSPVVSHSLETLELQWSDDSVVVQLTSAWADCPSALAGLTSLSLGFAPDMELGHFITLMKIVARNSTSLNRLRIALLYVGKNVQDFVKAVALPVSIRHFDVREERWSSLNPDDIQKITEELSVYKNMEYFSFGKFSADISYDREVYGPLSNAKCQAAFIQTMQARFTPRPDQISNDEEHLFSSYYWGEQYMSSDVRSCSPCTEGNGKDASVSSGDIDGSSILEERSYDAENSHVWEVVESVSA